jgi:hypothetical protein
MEFTITTGELLAAEQALNEFAKVKMRGSYGISVARLLKKISKAADKAREGRAEIVKKNGELQPDGKYKVKEGHELSLEKDSREWLNTEVKVLGDPLPRGISDVEVEPRIWLPMMPFLQEEVDRAKKEEQECKDE